MAPKRQLEQAWAEQWRAAAAALAAQRRAELRSLTHERALAAADALLALAQPERLSPQRRRHSGLVEQQAVLHRRSR